MSTAGGISSQKTIQQIIDETASSAKGRDTGELGKDDFLNLLVTQLRYQDPLNPTDDKEFIGQMAQFSALEQMQNLNNSFAATKAFSLIGKYITATVPDKTTSEASEVAGYVTDVKLSGGKTYVVVEGEDILVENITNVSEGSNGAKSNIAAYTGLIGFQVNGLAYDPENGSMIKVNGVVKAIQKGVYEDYAVMDGVAVNIAELVSDTKSTDPDYMKNKLQEAMEDGKEISFYIVDRETGARVPVTATIQPGSLDFTGGNIKAVINGLRVPVEGITNIRRPEEAAEADILGDVVKLLNEVAAKVYREEAPEEESAGV